jgi:hypothetical protein
MQIYSRQFAKMEICASVIVNIWQNFAELFEISAVSRKGGNQFVPTRNRRGLHKSIQIRAQVTQVGGIDSWSPYPG